MKMLVFLLLDCIKIQIKHLYFPSGPYGHVFPIKDGLRYTGMQQLEKHVFEYSSIDNAVLIKTKEGFTWHGYLGQSDSNLNRKSPSE